MRRSGSKDGLPVRSVCSAIIYRRTLNPMQQADDDEQHHDGEDDGDVGEPGRVGDDEGSGGVEGERHGEAADPHALREEEAAATRAATVSPA